MKKNGLTEEKFQRLQMVIEEQKGKKGPLMPVLHEAQKIFGYIPLEVQKRISEEIEIPLSEIYGVITFYSQFSLEPKGDYVIGVCMGTACYVKGSQPIIDKISELTGTKPGGNSEDGRFSLVATRCIGACGLAPVLTVNEDVYGRLKLEDIPGIVEKYQVK
ncbi:NADH dehydrogenase (ubiquinone), 24 kDa subunit [Alkaliphilus metalliredigens QYMF]|uniref:NADH dehydrogenase (Ubiquinone), 24 kDa subunit n=1 Tax=Alkaliphilus metalliredigens (strain QYMF) TaxID=293826 RepID=A6TVH3_ALKMQ|nr:NAD(P)H-dependent oxidoreductase subunit E [Alkaliphilus metalliredigens]ABR50191.1 NADH dehydrogenase (ubiquinone), 24 kDa subunit [Alkaliphilus metalliredigens QYMF]